MDDEEYDVLSKIKTLIETEGSPDGITNKYSKRAEPCNTDPSTIGCWMPPEAVELLMKACDEHPTNKCKILDVECGNGLVGKALRSLGFKGTLHGIDGSKIMASVSRDTGCYDDIVVQAVSSQESIRMPSDEKYDAVICVGAFTKNHLKAKVIGRLADALKLNGTLVFSIREGEDNALLFQQISDEVTQLKQGGSLEEICCVETSHNADRNSGEESSSAEREPSILHVFCMRRL